MTKVNIMRRGEEVKASRCHGCPMYHTTPRPRARLRIEQEGCVNEDLGSWHADIFYVGHLHVASLLISLSS